MNFEQWFQLSGVATVAILLACALGVALIFGFTFWWFAKISVWMHKGEQAVNDALKEYERAPLVQQRARVVKKSQELQNGQTVDYASFQLDDGDVQGFQVESSQFVSLQEGQAGTLVTKLGVFEDFREH